MKVPTIPNINNIIKQIEDRKIPIEKIKLEIFTQIWPNTSMGIDCSFDGVPYVAGQMLCEGYITIVTIVDTNIYIVFSGEECLYVIEKPTPKFYKDLKNKTLASRSEALNEY